MRSRAASTPATSAGLVTDFVRGRNTHWTRSFMIGLSPKYGATPSMKVLITGGSGFLGAHLIQRLHRATPLHPGGPADITVFDLRPPASWARRRPLR